MNYKTILLLFVFINVNAQNLRVDYDVVFKNDAIDNKNSSYLQSFITQAKKDISSYPMDFIISKNSYSIDFSNSMQIEFALQKTITPKELTLSLIGLSEKVYYEDKFAYQQTDDFIIEYDNLKLGFWEITNETKTILGYKCNKAIYIPKLKSLSNKKMFFPNFAWFTTDLSYQGGPTVFGNIPGLILEIDLKLVNIIALDIEITDDKVKSLDLNSMDILTYSDSEKYYNNKN